MLNPTRTKQTTNTTSIGRKNDGRKSSTGMKGMVKNPLKRGNHSLDSDYVKPIASWTPDMKNKKQKNIKNKKHGNAVKSIGTIKSTKNKNTKGRKLHTMIKRVDLESKKQRKRGRVRVKWNTAKNEEFNYSYGSHNITKTLDSNTTVEILQSSIKTKGKYNSEKHNQIDRDKEKTIGKLGDKCKYVPDTRHGRLQLEMLVHEEPNVKDLKLIESWRDDLDYSIGRTNRQLKNTVNNVERMGEQKEKRKSTIDDVISDKLYENFHEFITLNSMNLERLHGQPDTFKFKVTGTTLETIDGGVIIEMVWVVFDGGSNTDLVRLKDYSLEDQIEIRRNINAFSGETKSYDLYKGSLGDLTTVLSMIDGSGKNIIVPSHARLLWPGCITFWVVLPSLNTQLCILHMTEEIRKKFKKKTSGVVIAVVSPTTNYIEMWTRQGLQLLNIKSTSTVDPYLIKIPVTVLDAAIGDINTLNTEKAKNQGDIGHRTSSSVNNLHVKETAIELETAETQLNVLERTIEHYLKKNQELESEHFEMNNLDLVERAKHGDSDNSEELEFIINTTKMCDRYSTNTLDILRMMCGGRALSTIQNWKNNGTMAGLDAIDNEQWTNAVVEYAYAKSAFTKLSRICEKVRSSFSKITHAGQQIQFDFIYYHTTESGGKRTNIKCGKSHGGLLAIDTATGRPWFRPMASQKATNYVRTFAMMIKQIRIDINNTPNSVEIESILWDQHATQFSSLIIDEIYTLNKDPKCNITPVAARLNKNDLAVLNRVSAILHQMATLAIMWSDLPDYFLGYAYEYEVIRYYYLPNTSSKKRGLGFSPFSLWTGVQTSTAHLPIPFGISAIIHSSVKSKVGGIDVILIGRKGREMMYYTPHSDRPIMRSNAIHFVMQPDKFRWTNLLLKRPIFDESTLCTLNPKFATAEIHGITWVKDHSQTKSTNGFFYGVDDIYSKGSQSSVIGNKRKMIRCVCMKSYHSLPALRSHVKKVLNSGCKHPSMQEMPSLKNVNKRNKIIKSEKLQHYNAKIMQQIRTTNQVTDNKYPFYSIGSQMKQPETKQQSCGEDMKIKESKLLKTIVKASILLEKKSKENQRRIDLFKNALEELEKKQREMLDCNDQVNEVVPEVGDLPEIVGDKDGPGIEPPDIETEESKQESKQGVAFDRKRWSTDEEIKLKTGRWSAEEDERFGKAVDVWGEKWIEVAKIVKTRTNVGCRDHYQSYKTKKKKKPKKTLTAKKQRKVEKVNKKIAAAKIRADIEGRHLKKNVTKAIKRLNRFGRELTETKRLIYLCNIIGIRKKIHEIEQRVPISTLGNATKMINTTFHTDDKAKQIHEPIDSHYFNDKLQQEMVVNHLQFDYENYKHVAEYKEDNAEDKDKTHTWMNDSYYGKDFVEDELEKIKMLDEMREKIYAEPFYSDTMKAKCTINSMNTNDPTKFWEVDDLDRESDFYQLNELNKTLMKLGINNVECPQDKANMLRETIMQSMPEYLQCANLEINMTNAGIESTPMVTEKTFAKGAYADSLPNVIPSFQHMSINQLIQSMDTGGGKNPNWENKSKYDGDEMYTFEEPLSEINQCLLKLDPAVLTGLKHMTEAERGELRTKITAANRRDFIPANAWRALDSVFALDFVDAMEKEFASISKLGVLSYEVVPQHKINEIVTCKCVFDIKWNDERNCIEKFKCRMVAHGFKQREWNEITKRGNYDSKSCSSPVLKSASLKGMLAVAGSTPNTSVMINDVGTAFLCAKLKTDGSEDIYLQLPSCCEVWEGGIRMKEQVLGFSRKLKMNKKTGKREKVSNKPRLICKLVKALYGLRNASSAFYNKVVNFLTKHKLMEEFEWKVSDEDPCLFTSNTSMGSIMSGIHVDDLLSVASHNIGSETFGENGGTNSQVLKRFQQKMEKYFVDEGSSVKTKYANSSTGVQFLGTIIKREKDGSITMGIESRIETACERLNLKPENVDDKPKTPYASGDKPVWRQASSIPTTELEKRDTIKLVADMHPEQSIKTYEDVVNCFRVYTGNGIWFAETAAPYVMPTVYMLARFQTFPGIDHFHAIRRVFRYMYANKHRKLTFGKQKIDHQNPLITSRKALVIFTDTSHGDCPITRKATGGYCVFLFGSLVLIRSFRLSCVTTSTAQSEYYMMSAAAAESIYIMELYNKNFLPFINNALNSKLVLPLVQNMPVLVSKLAEETIRTLNAKEYPEISQHNTMMLYGDNSAAISMAQNGPSKNSKHSSIKASWLWECHHIRKIISTHKVHTSKNPSDICTKLGIKAETFEKHVRTIMGENETVDVIINHMSVAFIIEAKGEPEMVSIIKHTENGHRVGVLYNLY